MDGLEGSRDRGKILTTRMYLCLAVRHDGKNVRRVWYHVECSCKKDAKVEGAKAVGEDEHGNVFHLVEILWSIVG